MEKYVVFMYRNVADNKKSLLPTYHIDLIAKQSFKYNFVDFTFVKLPTINDVLKQDSFHLMKNNALDAYNNIYYYSLSLNKAEQKDIGKQYFCKEHVSMMKLSKFEHVEETEAKKDSQLNKHIVLVINKKDNNKIGQKNK